MSWEDIVGMVGFLVGLAGVVVVAILLIRRRR